MGFLKGSSVCRLFVEGLDSVYKTTNDAEYVTAGGEKWVSAD